MLQANRDQSMHALRTVASFAVLAAVWLLASPVVASANPPPTYPAAVHLADVFTPVVVTPLGTRHVVVAGTDDRYHVVYELQ